MEKYRWGDIIRYKGNPYFVVEEKKKVIKVRKIIKATNQVGYSIISIPNSEGVELI
jgi:NMD protein affecting ribosome stability and mRNA decay